MRNGKKNVTETIDQYSWKLVQTIETLATGF